MSQYDVYHRKTCWNGNLANVEMPAGHKDQDLSIFNATHTMYWCGNSMLKALLLKTQKENIGAIAAILWGPNEKGFEYIIVTNEKYFRRQAVFEEPMCPDPPGLMEITGKDKTFNRNK